MVSLSHFSIGFKNRTLLRDVDTVFPSGALTAIIGRNGAGKSTLLRALAGFNSRYQGDIIIDGSPLRSLPRHQLARRIAFVSTERVRIPNLRCRDVVGLGRAPYTDWLGQLSAADRRAVDEALEQVEMLPFAERTMDSMSDGECQRVMIARALAQDTENILLDEPTSFLDLPSRYALAAMLSRLARDHGKTVIFSTHELDIARNCCDFIALLADETIANLPAKEMKTNNLIETAFNLPTPSIPQPPFKG